MNKVILKGRLAQEINVKKKDDKSYVNFSLAFIPYAKKEKDDVCFVSCVAFHGCADYLGKFFTKGNLVQIEGVLNERKFVRKDGSKGSKIEILVERVESLEPKEKNLPDSPNEVVEPVEVPDEDLPF